MNSSPAFDSDVQPIEQLAYEDALAQLETIVTAMETEELPLETALALFERGQALARHCSTLLDRAELRVRQLDGDQLSDFDA
jgi:exodeoxyribonuclease VII small subunit